MAHTPEPTDASTSKPKQFAKWMRNAEVTINPPFMKVVLPPLPRSKPVETQTVKPDKDGYAYNELFRGRTEFIDEHNHTARVVVMGLLQNTGDKPIDYIPVTYYCRAASIGVEAYAEGSERGQNSVVFRGLLGGHFSDAASVKPGGNRSCKAKFVLDEPIAPGETQRVPFIYEICPHLEPTAEPETYSIAVAKHDIHQLVIRVVFNEKIRPEKVRCGEVALSFDDNYVFSKIDGVPEHLVFQREPTNSMTFVFPNKIKTVPGNHTGYGIGGKISW